MLAWFLTEFNVKTFGSIFCRVKTQTSKPEGRLCNVISRVHLLYSTGKNFTLILLVAPPEGEKEKLHLSTNRKLDILYPRLLKTFFFQRFSSKTSDETAEAVSRWLTVFLPSPQTSCLDLDKYLRGPLSQYLVNVSTAAELCSQALCGSHGRCLRRNPDSDVYLHLNPLTHGIIRQNGRPTVTGELSEADVKMFQRDFQCQCYSGFQGCNQTDPLHQKGNAAQTTASAAHCVFLLIVFLLFS